MARRNNSGHWGEAVAAEYLRKKHYTLLGSNFHSRFGEIDLIAKNRRFVVFIEVKTRNDDRYVQAREFVTNYKQARVRASAQIWLERNPTELQPRFDVIEVYAPEGVLTKHPVICHLEDAF